MYSHQTPIDRQVLDHYQPVPDGRFFTKANFFTLRNQSRENQENAVVSEQYQTDHEPAEQEVFEEMMQRRKQLNSVQVPAVPGQQVSAPREVRNNSLFNRNSNLQEGGEDSFRGTNRHNQLQPIRENPQVSHFEERTRTSGSTYPVPGRSYRKNKYVKSPPAQSTHS